MCGIFGTTRRYERSIVEHKLELMNFRGPDHTGMEVIRTPDGETLTLGHVRLSIIDLDSRSNQPFVYTDDISIVFNGEVYNFLELKKQYLGDVTLRTESDTEVICAMYEKYGLDSVKLFNGMFAFVIYDRRKNIMVGARDRLGKKPFYFWHEGRNFEFASQPKVIKYANDFHIDATARQFYLLQGVIPDPYSPFEEVKKLRAGECFTFNLSSGKLDIQTYWDVDTNSCGFTAPKSYDEAKQMVKDLLFDAVRLRLNANVPVGTFLSGGIDSSLICAIVSKFNKDLCAYTAGFDNQQFDESHFAVDVARSLGVPIKVCPCTGDDLMNVFNDYITYFDEPFADDSLIPSSLVAEKARQDVTVILGGDGGDELFYGYPKYEWTKARLHQYKKPYWLRKLFRPYFMHKGGEVEVMQSTQHDYADVYRSLGMFCYDMGGAEKFDRITLGKQQPDMKYLQNKQRGILAYSDYDMKTFMNAVNQKVDRATMRCSLELRSPIMDYRVAEYSRLLPYEYMINTELGLKRILKDILYEMVPRELLDRPKRGFVPPTKDWFRGELKEELLDIVSHDNIKQLIPELDVDKFITLRNDFVKGKDINSRMFFTLYTYVVWYKTYYIDK